MSSLTAAGTKERRQSKFRGGPKGKNAAGSQRKGSFATLPVDSFATSPTGSFEVTNSDRDARKMRYYIQLIQKMEHEEVKQNRTPVESIDVIPEVPNDLNKSEPAKERRGMKQGIYVTTDKAAAVETKGQYLVARRDLPSQGQQRPQAGKRVKTPFKQKPFVNGESSDGDSRTTGRQIGRPKTIKRSPRSLKLLRSDDFDVACMDGDGMDDHSAKKRAKGELHDDTSTAQGSIKNEDERGFSLRYKRKRDNDITNKSLLTANRISLKRRSVRVSSSSNDSSSDDSESDSDGNDASTVHSRCVKNETKAIPLKQMLNSENGFPVDSRTEKNVGSKSTRHIATSSTITKTKSIDVSDIQNKRDGRFNHLNVGTGIDTSRVLLPLCEEEGDTSAHPMKPDALFRGKRRRRLLLSAEHNDVAANELSHEAQDEASVGRRNRHRGSVQLQPTKKTEADEAATTPVPLLESSKSFSVPELRQQSSSLASSSVPLDGSKMRSEATNVASPESGKSIDGVVRPYCVSDSSSRQSPHPTTEDVYVAPFIRKEPRRQHRLREEEHTNSEVKREAGDVARKHSMSKVSGGDINLVETELEPTTTLTSRNNTLYASGDGDAKTCEGQPSSEMIFSSSLTNYEPIPSGSSSNKDEVETVESPNLLTRGVDGGICTTSNDLSMYALNHHKYNESDEVIIPLVTPNVPGKIESTVPLASALTQRFTVQLKLNNGAPLINGEKEQLILPPLPTSTEDLSKYVDHLTNHFLTRQWKSIISPLKFCLLNSQP